MTQSQYEELIWQRLNQSGEKTTFTRQRWLWAHDRKADYGAQDAPDGVWSRAYMAVHNALKDKQAEGQHVGLAASVPVES